jgi:hypothetical protein
MIRGFFYSKLNNDGSYGDPVPVERIENISITASKKDHETIDNIINWEYKFSIPLDRKACKEIAWMMMNLKRSQKRLISKNMRR